MGEKFNFTFVPASLLVYNIGENELKDYIIKLF